MKINSDSDMIKLTRAIYKGQPQLDASARGKEKLACVVVGPGPRTPS